MLPATHKLEGVELIRDGGSLAATFAGDQGSRYVLFFKICLDGFTRSNRERARYDQPVLIDCDPAKRHPNTEGVLYSELSGPWVSISWSQARDLLAEFAKSANLARPFDAKYMQAMIDVASRDGLPEHSINL